MPRLQQRTHKTQSGTATSFNITVPTDIINALGWKKGDNFVFNINFEKKTAEMIKVDQESN